MESFKERIEMHRSKIEQNVDVDKLYPLLQHEKALCFDEISQIEALPTKSAKVGKLLDVILSKDITVLQSFYLVLQKLYQHILTAMFSEPTFPSSLGDQQGSCSTSVTSDSEDDIIRAQLSDNRLGEFNSRTRMTRNDPNSTVSSSFPTFSEHFSPISQSADYSSSSIASQANVFVRHGYPDKSYDWFFKQFEKAFNELHGLKQQNAEMLDMRHRYDQLTKEMKHLREVYKTESQRLQQAAAEIHTLKMQQTELQVEKKQLRDENASLQKLRSEDKQELTELRIQQRKTAVGTTSNDGLGEIYAAVVNKYENICKEYDLLREKYPELMALHNSAVAKLNDVSEENTTLRSQLEDMRVKNEALFVERNGLKLQCTNAIREWNQMLIKHSQVKDQLNMVIKQRDDSCKDFNQTFAKHTELKKNYDALRAEKDAAIKEYALVMSERDTVHKEIEQLQDRLASMSKHVDILSKEKKELEAELDILRQNMTSTLSENEKYWRERGDFSGMSQSLKQQRDMSWKERHEAYEHIEQIIKEKYEKAHKEKAEEINNVTKETENLKQHLEKLKLDLDSAEQDAENANKNRDKAFSERDKIVQERESIRTLCDNLRRDRDRAVSDLAQALRDSDDFKRQKNDAVKELKAIKSRYEALLEKDSRRQQLHNIGHNNSRDSAIDADLQDMGIEIVEISVELQGIDTGDVGFDIVGGKGDPLFPNDCNLFVSHVSKGGIADGKLRVNDTILRINSLETVNVNRRTALQALRKSSGPIHLVVRRRKSAAARIWHPLQIVMACQKDSGIQVEQGLFISHIYPGGVVAKYGVLPCVGDRIISINNIPADNITPRDAMRILETSTDSLVLDVWRQTSPFSSAGSSPTPISVNIGYPLHDGTSVSNNLSKSDTLAVHNNSWDTPSYASQGTDSSKIVCSSGSQTDSLDNSVMSPCKSLHNHEPDKVRHSLPMLDKAKEKVERIFRVRHKSQDRDKDSGVKKETDDERYQRCQEQDKSLLKLTDDFSTQVNLSSTENIIAEFPSSAEYVHTSDSIFSTACVISKAKSSKTHKRDWELDSNSGTWPKTRCQQSQNVSRSPAVIFTPCHKPQRDQPSIRDIFYGNEERPPYKKSSVSGPAVPISIQNTNSDYNILSGVSSAFSPTSASVSIIKSHSNYNKCMPVPAITTKVQTPTDTHISKSQSHFVVGVMQGPNASSVVSSQGPPVFTKPIAAQVYGTVPSHKQHGINRSNPVSYHQSHTQPPGSSNWVSAPQDFICETNVRAAPKVRQMKSHRPTSTPQKQDLQWQTSISYNWTAGHVRDNPTEYHAGHQNLSCVTSVGSPPCADGTVPHYAEANVLGPLTAPRLISQPYCSMRPASLEILQPAKVTDFATSTRERNQMASLTGQGFITQPSYYQQHTNPTLFSPLKSTSQHSVISSPPGTFPINGSSDIEHDRPLSFHGVPIDRYSSPSPSQKSYNIPERFTPTVSDEFCPPHYQHSSCHSRTFHDDDSRHAVFKRERVFDRIRIPSTTSVNTKSGSLETAESDRSSPVSPIFHIDNRESIKYKGSTNSDDYIYRPKIPDHHETRDITFEKSSAPVGFKIQQGTLGGIFVSSVSDNSLAAQAGLVIGDQLLEVCGINMRNANYKHAITVLRQCGDNLTIKIQYNPEKYIDHQDLSSTTSINSSSITMSLNHYNLPVSEKVTPKHQSSLSRSCISGSGDVSPDKRRYITLKKSNPNMIGPGFSFVGGNAVGIFVHEIYDDCFVGGTHSLQRGDQILEFNGVDFRTVTAEKAMMQLTRPCATLVLCVFYNFAKYTKILTVPCDNFYIRANFDHLSEVDEELSFHRDDILFVDNSLYKNQLGTWFAWLVNDQGTKLKGGIIPSRIRLEDELVLRRTHSESRSLHETDDFKSSRRGSTSARRSFFRRKRHHRNSSKDSHEFGSFSDASLNSDSAPILDDSVLGYTQVEKIEFRMLRPVVLLSPLADALIKKLVSESPDKYKYCEPSSIRSSSATMEQSLAEGVLIDFWRKDDIYQCVRTCAVKEICDSNVHCLLSVKPSAIERMFQYKVYPITIFVRHKSAKQIRDIRDPQFLKDRTSNKLAREQFDQFQKIEQDYGHLFSAVIPGGNLAEMCMQIKNVINSEQKKAIWLTTSLI